MNNEEIWKQNHIEEVEDEGASEAIKQAHFRMMDLAREDERAKISKGITNFEDMFMEEDCNNDCKKENACKGVLLNVHKEDWDRFKTVVKVIKP